ncbi:deoxypodophyllotoxin synthase-like [Pyrus communis]|uniref:deoxypodophyllotoxin synthase-like n=1 Tax=Pyrus communis TaxID=23211 RepID=UPI0035BF5412
MSVTSVTQTVPKIPVVDFSQEDCLKPGTSSWLSVRGNVCRALEEFGCFMAVLPNKVSPELHDSMFGTLKELFDFPIETKAQTPQEQPLIDGHITGPFHESLAVGTDSEKSRTFEHHFWPNGNDQYRETADAYRRVMAELNQAVTRMVFENYNVEKHLDDHLQSTVSTLRFNKYKKPEKIGTGQGLSGHTDKTLTTILHQNHVKGLEIYTKDNKWIGFDPLPSSFLFMACDGFQVWSNDRILSCTHRVNLKENEERYSFGLFSYLEGVTRAPDELTADDHPVKYKPLHMLDYVQFYVANYRNVGVGFSVKEYCGV